MEQELQQLACAHRPMRGFPGAALTVDQEAVEPRQPGIERAKPIAFRAQGYALKYFAAGWWNTSADTEASGSIMKPSVRRTPMRSGRSRRQSVA